MVSYLLDTNIIIHFLKNADSPVREKFIETPLDNLYVCSIVKAELFYGSERSNNPVKSRLVQEQFLDHLVSKDFDDEAANHYAVIRANLEKKGTPIGGNDLMIASIALAHNLTLVSANTREFTRVDSLKIENWITEI